MSVKQKIFEIVKTAVSNVPPEDIVHEHEVDRESALKMAHAKKKWMIDYQVEREKKNLYVKQHLLSQNLDVSLLQKKIQNIKNTLIPSLDDINFTELQNLVDEI